MARTRKVAPAPVSTGEASKIADQTEKNASEVTVHPLRSYMDGGEIKKRGGPGYSVPKRHADALIAQGVASANKPESSK